MDSRARIPVESAEEFDEWFWNARPMERPGDSQSQRPTALQAVAPADSSPGHSIDSTARAPWGAEALIHGTAEVSGPSSAAGSIDFDKPPLPTEYNAGWYRRRAEDLGDLAAELISEGLDGTAYGQALRAAHYGRVALELYTARAAAWPLPHHPSNFL